MNMVKEIDNQKLYDRLIVISRLLAISLIRDVKSQQEKVRLLDEAGLSPYEIADLLEIKPVTVHVTLFNIRKKVGRKSKRK
jgi:DNA-directed RNA polymerase specialized sigma24 family protein